MSETRDFESLRPADQAIVRSLRILREREGAAEQYWQEMNFGARVRYVVGIATPIWFGWIARLNKHVVR